MVTTSTTVNSFSFVSGPTVSNDAFWLYFPKIHMNISGLVVRFSFLFSFKSMFTSCKISEGLFTRAIFSAILRILTNAIKWIDLGIICPKLYCTILWRVVYLIACFRMRKFARRITHVNSS